MSGSTEPRTDTASPAVTDTVGTPDRGLPIWMDRVSKWYGLVIGVNEISLRIESGIVALLGPNGSGKSTLIKLLTGQLRPSLGHLRIFGRSARSPAARRRVGYCPDVDAFYEEMTGREFVAAMLRLSGYRSVEARQRTERALDTVGMSDTATGRRAGKRLAACSKGMRQRIKLAQAIAHDPDLLILDEPLSGLDPVGQDEIHRLFRDLADQGKTLIISSHLLEEIDRIADQVVLIDEGRIITRGARAEATPVGSDVPTELVIESDRIRSLAAVLVQWGGVVRIEFPANGQALVTTRDPGGLCDEIGRLVREQDYRVERLMPSENWASTLFSMASGG